MLGDRATGHAPLPAAPAAAPLRIPGIRPAEPPRIRRDCSVGSQPVPALRSAHQKGEAAKTSPESYPAGGRKRAGLLAVALVEVLATIKEGAVIYRRDEA